MTAEDDMRALRAQVLEGGELRYHERNGEAGKLFARERIAHLLDPHSFVEDGLLANSTSPGLPADGVITGEGLLSGRPLLVVANDSTVKAGSWGRLTVEKILRLQERALRSRMPILYLVDSAGARITDQIEMFPGRRGAGRIFQNQSTLSGRVPQICVLFGPSAAGGAYIPAFCDVVIMVQGNASMYLGSPRMAEMVIGEKVTLEEMGGARMHCSVSGCGDLLATDERTALELARSYLSFFPDNAQQLPSPVAPVPAAVSGKDSSALIPADENKPFDMMRVILELIDEGSFFEIKPLYAKEIITALCRIEGHVVGLIASQPRWLGGVLFPNSANKAARFIALCDAFNIPLLFLADVPGFMIGTKVEREGIIRAGAKMIAAVSDASVPKLSVVVRKAYGAGLYAMCGPAFEPEACIALPGAAIAVMGPDAAVNAVYSNKIAAVPEGPERQQFVQQLREEYRQSVDLGRLASELVVDAVVPLPELRGEILARLLRRRPVPPQDRKHPIAPM